MNWNELFGAEFDDQDRLHFANECLHVERSPVIESSGEEWRVLALALPRNVRDTITVPDFDRIFDDRFSAGMKRRPQLD